jgi:colanic acid/amylovoran biosynthesis glycosyltransferase
LTKIALLYTTFPRPTETFVRRELRGLLNLGLNPDLYSIWKGDKSWEGKKVHTFPLYLIFLLLFWIPYWAWKKPHTFKLILSHLWANPCPNLQNWGETFLGLASALVHSKKFQHKKYTRIHAVWATMPATTALGSNLLTDIPFSIGAHAYDVFRNGGDWLLKIKLSHASFVRTSSQSTARRLLQLGTPERKLKLIHRSLKSSGTRSSFERVNPAQLHLLSVGRLVEKKGYFLLLEILSEIKRRTIPFQMKIIGAGPLRQALIKEIIRLGLHQHVSLLNHLDEGSVKKFYLQSDIFLFTGILADNEDRDGIPNVIPEAMSHGLLVLASNQAGSSEAFIDQVSGFSLNPYQKEGWADIIQQYNQFPDQFTELRKLACARAQSHFSSEVNCQKLQNLLL